MCWYAHRCKRWSSGRAIRLCGLLVVLAIASLPASVLAHASVIRAEPGFDVLVPTGPAEVRLYFSEPVTIRADSLIVLAPSGRRVDQGDATIDQRDPTVARVSIDAGEQGTYRVIYRALSRDFHVVGGTYTFSVGYVTDPPPFVLPAWSAAWYLQAFPRWLHLLALCLTGGPLVLSLFLRDRITWLSGGQYPWSLAWQASLLGVAGTVVFALIQAGGLGGSPASVFDPTVLQASLSGKIGVLLGARLLLFWVLYFTYAYLSFASQPRRAGLLIAWAAFLSLVVTTSLAGHAGTAPPVALSIVVDAIHTLAAVAWLGGLFVLLPALFRSRHAPPSDERHELLRRLLPRYSVTALVAFDLLLLTGAYQLWVNVERPAQLVTHAYGRALLVKGLLVAALVAVGSLTAWTFRDAWRPTIPATWRPGHRRLLVVLEAGLAVVLLASVGILSALPPARTVLFSADASGPPLTLASNAGTLLVTLSLAPAEPGVNQFTVVVQDSRGNPVERAQVSLQAMPPPDVGLTPVLVPLESGSSSYRGQLVIPTAGRWAFHVIVRPSETAREEKATFELDLPIPGARLLLEQVDAAMNRLRSAIEIFELTSGGPTVRTTAEYQAPDRLRYVIETPGQQTTTTIVVNDRRYDRIGNGPWSVSPWPSSTPFRWPNYQYARTASEIVLLGEETVDGVRCYVIGFLDQPSGARFRAWVGRHDFLMRRYEMMAPGHYMVASLRAFDDPNIRIDVPPSHETS